MAINVMRGESDAVLEQLMAGLRSYEADHPGAQIDLYRQDPYSVRVRVIDPHFDSLDRSERNQLLWRYFESVPDDAVSDISTLLLLAPAEVPESFGNMEFENPVPSVLL